jgi:hypothetical protein
MAASSLVLSGSLNVNWREWEKSQDNMIGDFVLVWLQDANLDYKGYHPLGYKAVVGALHGNLPQVTQTGIQETTR